jgi:hypothetical protein
MRVSASGEQKVDKGKAKDCPQAKYGTTLFVLGRHSPAIPVQIQPRILSAISLRPPPNTYQNTRQTSVPAYIDITLRFVIGQYQAPTDQGKAPSMQTARTVIIGFLNPTL